MAMRSPHEMDVDTWWEADEENENEEIQSLGRGGIRCCRCGGYGHVASKCGKESARKARASEARAARTGRAARAARARANTNGPASAAAVVSVDMDPGTAGPSSGMRRVTVAVAKEESVPWTTLGYEPLPRSRTRGLRHRRTRHRS